jgi:hypothetical protein
MTITTRLLSALASGEELTARQIESRFKVASARGLVHTLRSQGHAIYLNRRTNSKGTVTQKYRLGTPTRAMVATAFLIMGADRLGMTRAGRRDTVA